MRLQHNKRKYFAPLRFQQKSPNLQSRNLCNLREIKRRPLKLGKRNGAKKNKYDSVLRRKKIKDFKQGLMYSIRIIHFYRG